MKPWKERAQVGLLRSITLTTDPIYGKTVTVRVYEDRIAISFPSGYQASWRELQRIKEYVIGDVEAVEYYPMNGEVVDLWNTRHLWFGPTHHRDHPEFLRD